MSRDKQIYIDEAVEEMATAIRPIMVKCSKCEYYNDGSCHKPFDMGCDINEAILNECDAFYENGYRKSEDVARETVKAIKDEVRKKEQYVNDLFGYGGYVIATTDLEDIIRRYMFDTYEEAKLKKKYESEKENEI